MIETNNYIMPARHNAKTWFDFRLNLQLSWFCKMCPHVLRQHGCPPSLPPFTLKMHLSTELDILPLLEFNTVHLRLRLPRLIGKIVVDQCLPNVKCHVQMPLGHLWKQPEMGPWYLSSQWRLMRNNSQLFYAIKKWADLSGECST